MKKLRNRSKTVQTIGREMLAALRLIPWLLLAIGVAAVLWRVDLQATTGLFQSVPPGGGGSSDSPLPTATVPPTLVPPTLPPTRAPSPAPTQFPTMMPTAVLTPTQASEPTATAPLPTATNTLTPPTQTPLAPTVAPPTVTQVPVATSTPDQIEEAGRYPAEDSNLRFEWGMLFDSVALGLSYVWLCCGALVLLGIPVIFVVLWLAGKRQRKGEQ